MKESVLNYVNENYQKWEQIYEIPSHYEFEIKYMFQLEAELYEVPLEHVKTRREMLEMILKIKHSLKLHKKVFLDPNDQYVLY